MNHFGVSTDEMRRERAFYMNIASREKESDSSNSLDHSGMYCWQFTTKKKENAARYLHRKNLDSLDCVRLQLDHNASRACNHNALQHLTS